VYAVPASDLTLKTLMNDAITIVILCVHLRLTDVGKGRLACKHLASYSAYLFSPFLCSAVGPEVAHKESQTGDFACGRYMNKSGHESIGMYSVESHGTTTCSV
jgi:hypothetical protein